MTTINVRAKGANGEREVAKVLNNIIAHVMGELKLDVPDIDIVQRNQNQSAVGGNDLSNVFGLGIEVKRQEQLSINKWWSQCVAGAARNNELPVLIYRQNRKAWRVVMNTRIPLTNGELVARADLDWETFQQWFREWVKQRILAGDDVRV